MKGTESLKKMMNTCVAFLLFCSMLTFTISDNVVHYTSSGGVCQNACGYHGYDYTWCKQIGGNKKDWDYCSLEEGLEASGRECATACDFWGQSYRFCYTKDGKWHYCGSVGQKELLEYSVNNLCFTNCRASRGYFQCDTTRGIEHCSPFHDVTPQGLPCHTHYRCAKYGHSVYRCHTDDSEGQWDHCGRKSQDICTWISSESNHSQAEICTLSNSQKEGKIIFTREIRNKVFSLAKEEFRNAAYLIDKIDSITSLPDSGELAGVRLDKHEDIFCNGINYTDVELQIGISNENSVPIAHVLFPESLKSVAILRLAFYTSLHSTFYSPAYTIAVSVGEPMLCSTEL